MAHSARKHSGLITLSPSQPPPALLQSAPKGWSPELRAAFEGLSAFKPLKTYTGAFDLIKEM